MILTAEPPEAMLGRRAEDERAMDTLRILVTDDEPGMRLGAERTLRDFKVLVPDVHEEVNFVIDQAETGEEALEKIKAGPPDILLLDHKLPGISGLDVLDQTAGMHLEMLTIMITAYASIETAVVATKRGAYDFLAKPFTPDELKSTVRKAAIRVVLARQARKLAEEKRQVRFQFIRILGHELKAPLNAIDGFLQILKNHTLGNTIEAYDGVVGRSMARVEHMYKLIVDLLDMTRIESGQKARDLSTVDVREVARTSIETALPTAQPRKITINLHADDPVTMMADRGEIEMILNNLVSNAVKYNRDGGQVDVRLAKTDKTVAISVSDTGIGMSKEEAAKLFGEFVRIKNAKTRSILGSGLGLSIVKRLAMLYDGSASVESEPDVGSTFAVSLKDLPAPPATPAPVQSITDGG
jgi:two-component system, sensor histidine kinase and response regulator